MEPLPTPTSSAVCSRCWAPCPSSSAARTAQRWSARWPARPRWCLGFSCNYVIFMGFSLGVSRVLHCFSRVFECFLRVFECFLRVFNGFPQCFLELLWVWVVGTKDTKRFRVIKELKKLGAPTCVESQATGEDPYRVQVVPERGLKPPKPS